MHKRQGQEPPVLIDWDHRAARRALRDTSKVVVVDWDHTLVEAVPMAPIGQKAPSNKDEGFLATVRYGLNGEPTEHALFLRPHAIDLIEACKSVGYKLVLWSQGVPEYVSDCLRHFEASNQFDLIIPRHPSSVVQPKDLWIIRPNLTSIVSVDDSLSNSVLNPFNAIEIERWGHTHTSDTQLNYIPALLQHRFLALEDLSPESLAQLRELALRQIAQASLQKIFGFIANGVKQRWEIAGEQDKALEIQSDVGVSSRLQNSLEETIQSIQDIMILTLVTFDLNTLIEVMTAQWNHRNAHLQNRYRATDQRPAEQRLQEIDDGIRNTLKTLKKIFEQLIQKTIQIA
jgi:hypothetical protein